MNSQSLLDAVKWADVPVGVGGDLNVIVAAQEAGVDARDIVIYNSEFREAVVEHVQEETITGTGRTHDNERIVLTRPRDSEHPGEGIKTGAQEKTVLQ